MVELVPALLRQELARLAEEDTALTVEAAGMLVMFLLRPIAFNAEGSAKVVMGGTVVLRASNSNCERRGPTARLRVPGCAVLNCGLLLDANGPPSPESIELGRVVDRGIRESGCIDMESLCTFPERKSGALRLIFTFSPTKGTSSTGSRAIAALRLPSFLQNDLM